MGILDLIPQVIDDACDVLGVKEAPDLIPIISTFGFGFGTGATYPALDKINERYPDSMFLLFVVTPFNLEGVATVERAARELKAISERYTTFVISNETVARRFGIDERRLGIDRVYGDINKTIERVISVLINGLTASEGISSSFDRSDLSKVLTGQTATLTLASFPRAESLSLTKIKELERKEWFETVKRPERPERRVERLPLSATFIFDGSGDLSLGQISDINNYLFSQYLVDTGKLKPLIIKREKDTADFLLIKSGFELKVEPGKIYGVY